MINFKLHLSLQMHVSKICFLNRENSDVLLACCAGPGKSTVEVWHLIEQTIPLHRKFQSAANPELACKVNIIASSIQERFCRNTSNTHGQDFNE